MERILHNLVHDKIIKLRIEIGLKIEQTEAKQQINQSCALFNATHMPANNTIKSFLSLLADRELLLFLYIRESLISIALLHVHKNMYIFEGQTKSFYKANFIQLIIFWWLLKKLPSNLTQKFSFLETFSWDSLNFHRIQTTELPIFYEFSWWSSSHTEKKLCEQFLFMIYFANQAPP